VNNTKSAGSAGGATTDAADAADAVAPQAGDSGWGSFWHTEGLLFALQGAIAITF